VSERRVVLNFRETRPVWSAPDEVLARIAGAFPRDWIVEIVRARADGRGDGGSVSAEALAAVKNAEVYMGFGVPVEILRGAGPTLRWVHTGTAGVGALLYPEMRTADVILTNSAGIHAPPIADTVMGMILHFARGLNHVVRAQARSVWDTTPFERAIDGSIFELAGATLGLIGLGGIGNEVATRAIALGMHVSAVRRSDAPGPEGVTMLRGDDALRQLLEASDVVLVALPSTDATRGLLDRTALEKLGRNAILINVSRGDIIDEDALIDVLREDRIRGAALDVFRIEPLPPESPLWQLPNVLITPHISGTTPRFWEREAALILDNIARYLSSKPLRNVVDKQAGY
jgi:phosphoglycerate dehydrogenase-like enzyme